MKKIDLGQTISIIANVGVVAGIVFLGVELQQNTRSLEVTAYESLIDRILEINYSPIEVSGLSLLTASREAYDAVSDTERIELRRMARRRFRYGDLAFYQFELGMLPRDRLESAMRPLTDSLCAWLPGTLWVEEKQNYVSSYQDYIESKLAQC